MSALCRSVAAMALLAGSASASQASIDAQWPLMAFAQEAGCELQIHGNGKFTEVRASGLIPGEALHFTLSNADMKPLDWKVFADGSGRWTKLYLPFRFNRPGGTVAVSVAASRCTLSASVPWTRQVRTIP